MDEPLGDPAVLPTFLLARAARRHVVVALSGEGGDELFYGYPTYFAHRVARWLEPAPRPVGDALRAVAAMLRASERDFAFDFVAKRFAGGIGMGLVERHARWMSSLEPRKDALFTPEFHAALEDPTGLGPVRRIAADAPAGADPLLIASHCDLALYLQDGILMRTDKASMANGLEVRVPFLDHEVVRFARALPAELKLRGRTGKYLLRRLARGRLPPEIVGRRKKGFGVPVAKWLRGELRETLLETLDGRRLREQGIFRPEAVLRLVEEHQNGRHNHRKALWALLAFQLWFDRFVGTGRERGELPIGQGAAR
jgi:asparagine synthase (glutamine-hydrolysing)